MRLIGQFPSQPCPCDNFTCTCTHWPSTKQQQPQRKAIRIKKCLSRQSFRAAGSQQWLFGFLLHCVLVFPMVGSVSVRGEDDNDAHNAKGRYLQSTVPPTAANSSNQTNITSTTPSLMVSFGLEERFLCLARVGFPRIGHELYNDGACGYCLLLHCGIHSIILCFGVASLHFWYFIALSTSLWCEFDALLGANVRIGSTHVH